MLRNNKVAYKAKGGDNSKKMKRLLQTDINNGNGCLITNFSEFEEIKEKEVIL
jgi:hypothetical protein